MPVTATIGVQRTVVQVHEGVALQLVPTQTSPLGGHGRTRTHQLSVERRPGLALFRSVELMRLAMDLRHEAEKLLSFSQRCYKKNRALLVHFSPIVSVGDYIPLDGPQLFRLAAKRFAS